jgi:type IV pilus assembly protein PilE
MKQTQSGFTLVELMIVVAIVGILASIAVPSYQESVRKSRRADAKGALMGLANAMERHFTETNSYCDAGGADGGDSCGIANNDFGTPSVYTPSSETDTYYDFTINADITPSSYTISATPAGVQADDNCGTLTLTNTGQKDIADADPGVTKTDCW